MNKVSGINDDTLLRTADLAARDEFRLGEALIIPGSRTVRGPGGEADLEPRVMQVLVVLADAAGSVVTRETLFQRCWGNVFVGDDSLNRAVSGVRRIATSIAADSFVVETVTRTGYQLIIKSGVAPNRIGDTAPAAGSIATRRAAVAGGIAALALASGTGIWWINRQQTDPRFEALMAQGEGSLRKLDFGDQTRRNFEQATRIEPSSASAWGALALLRSMAAGEASPKNSDQAVRTAEEAARKAFALNSKEPNALLAMFELQGSMLDWSTRDQRLREIIKIDSGNMLAIMELVGLLQSAGLNRESWEWNERAISIEPLLAPLLGRRALKLWIAGRVLEADKVINSLRGLYPSDPFVWWVQFLILALSDRPRAAQAMINGDPSMLGPRGEAEFWNPGLTALVQRSSEAIAGARKACFEAAKASGARAAQSVMVLSALGQVDAAFDVANGFLLWRGSIVRGPDSASKQVRDDASWRIGIQWLFTPPVAVMRADERFRPLCDRIGLTGYWRARRIQPDYLHSDR